MGIGRLAAMVAFLSSSSAQAQVMVTTPPLPAPRPPNLSREAPGVVAPMANVPLPPPRPPDLVGPLPRPVVVGPSLPPQMVAPAPAPVPVGPGVPIVDELMCVRLFAGGKVEAHVMPPPVPAATGCGIPAPVEMSAVIDAAGRRIALLPSVTIDCALGIVVADWVRDDLVPAFAAGPGALVALTGTSGYACRGRNGVAGAKLSEHGRGNAMDIGAFKTASGNGIDVKQAGVPVLARVRDTACARFSTVLGPGSDGFHESHMHVDLEERRRGFKICHWDLPEAQGRTP